MIEFLLRSKTKSFWMKLVGLVRPDFMKDYWTTIGNVIYYPTSVENPYDKAHTLTIKHELIHVRQYQKLGKPLFLFLYLFFPLPVFLSYFRWKFEREAYLIQIKAGASIDNVVNVLWSGYLCPWPKSLMRKWFIKHKEKL